jgi:hypothetical protein
VEQVIVSREGIEMVFACFLSGKAPQMLMTTSGESFTSDVQYAIFVRPSAATSPGIAPVNSW